MSKLHEIKKEMLNHLLYRPYNVEFSPEITKIISNYEDEDCYDWDEETIDNLFYHMEKTLLKYEDPESNAHWELWYNQGWVDAQAYFNSKQTEWQ